jgi:RNA polymerase sigma factor (sigma-70 family)
MSAPRTDREVVAASVGEPSEFGEIFDRHYPAIAAYVLRRLGPSAEDAAAEVFVRAFRQRHRFRPDHETVLPWLYGITSNVIADQRRSERRRVRALHRLSARADDAHYDTSFGEPTLTPRVAKALAQLTDADRDALLLMAWGELDYQEIAYALDCPVGTVRSRIARARRTLVADLPGASPRVAGPNLEGEAHV